jgi:hypothetical protein
MSQATQSQLSPVQEEHLLVILQNRFEQNASRHPSLRWSAVQARLKANPEKLWSLSEMERTGGEPDVVVLGPETETYTFYDCSPESPTARRSVCYDEDALEGRKANKPKNSAYKMAQDMGIEMLTEAQYRALQELESFDKKTSSWIKTPDTVRELGGALFCDRRYNTVFVYHNGAESYYAGRGFRGYLEV